MSARIVGLGHHAPERVVPNAEIEARLALPAGWIEARTGVRARRYAAPGEALTDIAHPAAEMALRGAGRPQIGFLLLATSTPDHLLPPSAPLLAHRLGLACGAADIAGACAGFIDALALADGLARAQGCHVLVVAANVLSRRIAPHDRATSALFADAAGAVVIGPSASPRCGVIGVDLVSDGAGYDLIRIPAGGGRRPFAPDVAPDDLFMQMPDGGEVFRRAVELMAATAERALAKAGVGARDVACWIPHQANARITAAVRRRLGLEASRELSTLAEFGNSSAATIPFTLSMESGRSPIRAGDLVLMTAAGAGLAGGAIVLRW
jgi:3-oxoacyl-[acyl-carrier-protein] synthase-3